MQYEASLGKELSDPVYQVVGDTSWNSWKKTAMLVKHMTRRSLAARYRGSVLGFAWSLVNPVMMMFVYTFVFKYIFRMNAPGVPFPVYVMTGILAWNFLSMGAIQASVSLLHGASLINRSAFPRIVLPLSAVLANAVNYIVALPILILFGLIYGVVPTATFLLLPFALLLLIIMATGLGTLLAAIMPFFPDLQHLIEVFFTLWFFLTPIVYDISLVPDAWHSWYRLNPMVGIFQFVHSVFLSQPMPGWSLALAVTGSFGILGLGVWVFSRLALHCTEV